VIYTVVASCKLVGVNPESYLTWVLPILAAETNCSTAQGLLPHDFARLNDGDALTHCAPSRNQVSMWALAIVATNMLRGSIGVLSR
jgi:IS66 C-terminal element